jgi:ABC-type glutathione transport system ATPase component
MTHALELRGVTRGYVGHLAVDDLSLDVPRGSIYGILGPNGAGKSTTLRMVMNIISRDSGTITLLGEDPARTPAVLRRTGYLPEERGLYKKMTALEAVVFFAALRGMRQSGARKEAARWLEKMGLREDGAAGCGEVEIRAEAFANGLFEYLHGGGTLERRFSTWVDVVAALPRRTTTISKYESKPDWATYQSALGLPKPSATITPICGPGT